MRTMQAPPVAPTAPAAPILAIAPVVLANDANGRLMERFLKIQPLTFAGISKEPLQLVKWAKEMENAFEFFGCIEEQKVTHARYKVQHEAEVWWQITKPILAVAHPNLTWEIFKEAFFGIYFLSSVKKKKEIELAELTQGPKLVLEYQQKFEELFFCALPPSLEY
ncbi:uncharacterized protein LOC122665565 [Telopea speciosissima]|uniref:uncharacterized protein LOC122665565 n=1 Tax=Telopea speciosissima TaxID=54955 RepID=UPI001CC6C6F2|nr:uncharacterized protein LOC122665565 [Telopea speciosissima]